jgi:hypothetical protein
MVYTRFTEDLQGFTALSAQSGSNGAVPFPSALGQVMRKMTWFDRSLAQTGATSHASSKFGDPQEI